MDDTRIFKEMFQKEMLLQPEKEYGKKFILLSEPSAPDSSAKISGLPEDVIIIKTDRFSNECAFKGTKGECKRADYVIMSEEARCVVYIELKSTTAPWKDIVAQLSGAKCFVSYCRELGQEFWQRQGFLSEYKHRFVAICRSNMPKRRTRITTRYDPHDSPDKALRIDCPHYLPFEKLAGNCGRSS